LWWGQGGGLQTAEQGLGLHTTLWPHQRWHQQLCWQLRLRWRLSLLAEDAACAQKLLLLCLHQRHAPDG
jgi:hypothetical protein